MGKIVTDLSLKKAKLSALANKRELKSREEGFPGNDFVRAKTLTPLRAPDKGFVKQLKAIDKDLEVVWDTVSTKWEIWKFPDNGGEPYHVTTVQTKDRNYKELSAETLVNLRMSYSMTTQQIFDYMDEVNEQILRRKREEIITYIKDVAWESFINIHCKVIQVPRELKIAEVAKNGL